MVPTVLTTASVARAVATADAIADAEMDLALVISPFSATPSTMRSDLTLATFTGSAPKVVPISTTDAVIYSTANGQWGIRMIEPAGGFTFVCSEAPAFPETVYGYALLNSSDDVLFSGLLPTPIEVNSVGNFVELSGVLGYLPIIPLSPLLPSS